MLHGFGRLPAFAAQLLCVIHTKGCEGEPGVACGHTTLRSRTRPWRRFVLGQTHFLGA